MDKFYLLVEIDEDDGEGIYDLFSTLQKAKEYAEAKVSDIREEPVTGEWRDGITDWRDGATSHWHWEEFTIIRLPLDPSHIPLDPA